MNAVIKKQISAFILAGGLGTRLRSVSRDQKVVTNVSGVPFIYYLLQQLDDCSIDEVVLGVGYQAEGVKDKIKSQWRQMKIRYALESEPLGTGGAILNAADRLNHEWILIMNGDSFLNENLAVLIEKAMSWNKEAIMILAKKDKKHEDCGRVVMHEKGEIIAFMEKREANVSELVNAGIYIVKQEFIRNLPRQRKFSIEKDVFEKIAGTKRLYGLVTEAELVDIGTPERLQYAQNLSCFSQSVSLL